MIKKLVPLLLLTALASAQSFVTVTASKIYNGSSGLLSSGTISFQAVGSNQQPISYQVGGGGQQILFPTICAIQNGAIIGGCQVANVLVTLPQMLCFSVTVDDASNTVVLGGPGSGYTCLQPTPNSSWCVNATCDFDNFSPNLPNNITVTFPFPSATNIGGVFADQCSANNFVNGVFPTGHLSCAPGGGGGGGSGNVSNSGTPVAAQLAQWVDSLHIQGINASGTGSVALTGSPVFTGTPTAPTPGITDNSTTLSTTAFVKAQGYAVLASLAPSATTDTTNAANITSGVLVNARIPTPSATALGGVETFAAPAHTFFNTLSINGVFGSAQPACGDLSNAAPSCATDATNAGNITSGTLSLARVPLQGNGSKVLAAGTINGATGSEICTDANGNATTVGCTAGGGNVNNSGTPTVGQVAVWVDSTHIQGNNSIAVTVGGLNTTTAPIAGQIPVAASASAYAPVTMSGDATLSSAGAITVSKTGGVAFAASATTNALNAANISSGTLPAARLPNPTATTLGGVESLASTSHQWINAISTAGVPSSTQPACGDLSNSAPSCSTDTTNAANIASGTLAPARGGTGSGTAPTSGQVPVGNSGGTAYAPVAVSGDATLSNTGALTVTKTNGVSFAPSATTDTTNAANISSGTLAPARGGTGATTAPSSAQIPVGNAGGTAYAPQTLSGDGALTNSGVLTVTKTNGVVFAASATTNTVNASNITSGTLPHAQLPALVSGDIPNNAANTTGTAANLSGTPALPNGTTATSQALNDATTKLATDAFVTGQASTTTPSADTTSGAIGTSLTYARADHTHPTDSTRAPIASPSFTGTVTLPITGSTQCLHVNSSGAVSGTGADCGSGGGGSMVWPAAAGVAVYSGSNSWSTSLTVGGAANNLLAFDSSDNITMPGNATVGGQLIIDQPFWVQSTLPGSSISAASSSHSLIAFDTDGKLKVSENAGTVTEVAKVNSNITGNAATATALAGTPTQCTGSQFATGIASNGNANCATPAGGGGGGTTLHAFVYGTGNNAMTALTVNSTEMWGYLIPGNLTTSHICFVVNTADSSGTDMYDVGVYDGNGNLLAHIGATAGSSLPSGGHCYAFVASATVSAGKFYLALTGTAATLKLGGTTGEMISNFCSVCTASGSTGTTTGGALNSSLTLPAENWVMNTSQQTPAISLF